MFPPLTDSDRERFQQRELLRLDPDRYSRYRCGSEIILSLARARRRESPFRLLDVGGSTVDLFPSFLGGECREVIRADRIDLGRTDPRYKRLDEDGPLPFADRSFEVVVALDVLEQAAQSERPDFVRECLRVAADFVILSSPRGELDVERAETLVNNNHRRVYGHDHPILATHARLGLATSAETAKLFDALETPWWMVENSYLPRWLMLGTLADILRKTGDDANVLGDFNEFYNRRYYDEGCQAPGYRSIYILAKRPELFTRLPQGWTERFYRKADPGVDIEERFLTSGPLILAEFLRREGASGLEERVGVLDERIGTLHDRTADLHSRTSAILDQLQDRQSRLEGELTRVQAGLEQNSASLVENSELEAEIPHLQSRIGAVVAQLRQLEGRVESVARDQKDQLDTVTRVATESKDGIDFAKHHLGGLVWTLERDHERMAAMESEQALVRVWLRGIRQALASTNQALKRLKSQLVFPALRKLFGPREGSDHVGELIMGRTVSQPLRMAQPWLRALSLQVGTFDRSNPSTLRLRLRPAGRLEDSGEREHSRESIIEVTAIENHGFATFDFAPIVKTGDYIADIDAPDGLPGCAVTLLVGPGEGLIVDGQRRPGAIRSSLVYGEGPQQLAEAPSRIKLNRDQPPVKGVPALSGVYRVEGWAFSDCPIKSVEVLIDGHLMAKAIHGFPRPDVESRHPGSPHAVACGFRAFIDTTGVAPGTHELTVRATDAEARTRSSTGPIEVAPAQTIAIEVGTPDRDIQHQSWLSQNRPTEEQLAAAAGAICRLRKQPLVSILMPCYNTDPALLAETVDSVLAQVYRDWELVAVDDASTDPDVASVLAGYAAKDRRIRIIALEENRGIAGASQVALEAARGEYVGFLDHDDILWPNALYEVVRRINQKPSADLIYSDEDKISVAGKHLDPFFKPDWSPHLLLSINYLSHFSVYRRSIALEAGGFNASLSGSQDYDLALRVAERTQNIEHIPTILYSWRASPGSAAADPKAKLCAIETTATALGMAAQRRGFEAEVVETRCPPYRRLRRTIVGDPLVSILVPTGMPDHLGRCLASVIEKTTWTNYELIVIDNSQGSAVAELVAAHQARDARVKHVAYPRKPFNYSAINNFAAARAEGQFLCLLNDDTEVIEPDWLIEMLSLAQLPEMGVVGARLEYPDGSVQHAGVVLGVLGLAGHAFRFYPPDHFGYMSQIELVRDTSAVTFACAVIPRAVWEECGGLDETHLPISFNDVDFCLRAREAGHQVVYTPYARLVHHESATRGTEKAGLGAAYMRRRWGRYLAADPFYNPNLTHVAEDYSLNIVQDHDSHR